MYRSICPGAVGLLVAFGTIVCKVNAGRANMHFIYSRSRQNWKTDDLFKNFWVVCRCWHVVCMIRTVDPAYCDSGVGPVTR
ncbi:hypothetical protein GGS24DRAFT_451985 [Hypoxylon argillaceum]|nr:hypothetical protein GGS24DRAFT_451985 [Hypoxylon argillaceum]